MRIGNLLKMNPVTLVALDLFVVFVAFTYLVDPDYFWHLKAGEWIVGHGALAPGDVFSYTREGQPWVQHEWLFEVLLYGVHQYAGDFGVKLLTAGLFLGAFGIACHTAYRFAGTAIAVVMMAAVAIFPFCVGLAPRPQLVTFLGVALMLAVLLRFKYARALRPLALLPLTMLAWVNCHGGYATGMVLLVAFVACECYVAWRGTSPNRATRRELTWLGGAVAATLLATLANPWFVGHWAYPFEVMGMSINSHLQEWKSPDFTMLVPMIYLLLVLLFGAACARACARLDLTEWAVPTLFLLLGFTAVRHMPLAALIALPFGALALGRSTLLDDIGEPGRCLARHLGSLTAGMADRWPGARRPAGQSASRAPKSYGTLPHWMILIGLVLEVFVLRQTLQATEQAKLQKTVPVAAADFVARHGLRGRMFNAYEHGGYLIYRFAPTLKVLVDGRADVYGDAFLYDYLGAYRGLADWKRFFDPLQVDFALLPRSAPLRQLLLAEGSFREVHRDAENVVMVRAGDARYAALPALAEEPARPVRE